MIGFPMKRTWFKSSYSVANSACVEVAIDGDTDTRVLMRDSKNPSGITLTFDREGWNAFIGNVKSGRLRRP